MWDLRVVSDNRDSVGSESCVRQEGQCVWDLRVDNRDSEGSESCVRQQGQCVWGLRVVSDKRDSVCGI